MKRVYMAGCGGMLGQAFHEEFDPLTETRCTDIDVNEDWLEHLDFRDFDAYRDDVVAFAPDYLFHIGALTDLKYCETHQDDAYATNAMAVENAATSPTKWFSLTPTIARNVLLVVFFAFTVWRLWRLAEEAGEARRSMHDRRDQHIG